jgi:adenylate cyclase
VKKTLLSRFYPRLQGKWIPTFLSLSITFAFACLLFIDSPFISNLLRPFENLSYDLQLRHTFKPLPKKEIPITLVDVDDKSIRSIGRWPWPRKKMAELVTQLQEGGATVIALDITFPEEENTAEDSLLAKSLSSSNSVLGMIWTNDGASVGSEPIPLLKLSSPLATQLSIPQMKYFINNIAPLAASSKAEGFINAVPDADGVLRFSPLLYAHQDNVYGSLALQAARIYLLSEQIQLITQTYSGRATLEGIQLDNILIPTDEKGRILIPFRGPPFSFPYISAIDVLEKKAPSNSLAGKLIFVGSTASAIGDTRPTAIAPIFPGLEVHANIAMGIFEQYFPYKPVWGKGVLLLALCILGIGSSLAFPRIAPLGLCLLFFSSEALLFFGNRWIWTHSGIVLFIYPVMLLLLILFLFNLAYGYLTETKRRKEIRSIFGQYVPEEYLKTMLLRGGDFGLEGESKELTVLFSDMNGFTSISEHLSATQVKEMLNFYFSPLTEIIFETKGTIDKYVGDMIVAFWGAPLENNNHAQDAVSAALKIQGKIKELNAEFAKTEAFRALDPKTQIKFGIGLNTGIMNVGDMGSKFRRSYTVLGDSVNLGSRLEGMTRFYHVDIIIGEDTWQKIKNDFICRKLDKIKVKGKQKAVEIYAPICPKQEVSVAMLEELDQHTAAFNLYLKRDWEGAKQGFLALGAKWPERAPLYSVYLERIETFKSSPPDSGWDGSYALTQK